MLRAINHSDKKIICCPAMCGTTYLHLQVLKTDNWEHIRGSILIPSDYTIYKVIRNPIDRFYSWYNVYISGQGLYHDSNHIFIKELLKEENIEGWFRFFSTAMHYDEHCALQKYLHQFDDRFNLENIKYVVSKQLKSIVHNTDEEYIEKHYNKICNGLEDKYLVSVYKDDLEWIKSLEV